MTEAEREPGELRSGVLGDGDGLEPSGTDADPVPAYARRLLDDLTALPRNLTSVMPGDPVLNILLFLVAEAERGPQTTSACCGAAAVPRSTALRYIKLLMDRGVLLSRDDEVDRRITLIDLSEEAKRTMRAWLRHGRAAFEDQDASA